jgi:hypothetical protein
MSQPFKLFRLQQVDSQLDQALARLKEIEAILSDQVALRQAQELCSQAETTLNEARKNLRHAEQEVQAQHIKVEQTEASLYGGKIHNPKELQDLQKEAASLKRFITILEDRQLDVMLSVEEAEAACSRTQQALEALRAQTAVQHSGLIQEKTGLLQRVQGLEADRHAVAGSVEQADMQLYDTLRQQRRGVAVAHVVDSACGACGSILTPGQAQAAHSPSQISRCGFCGRILYAG